jgi:hypothetical protein
VVRRAGRRPPAARAGRIYGPGDTYKSFVALDWACHLATEGKLVLYIAAAGASGIRARSRRAAASAAAAAAKACGWIIYKREVAKREADLAARLLLDALDLSKRLA